MNDKIVVGNDLKEREALKRCLTKEFEINKLEKLKYFLGIEVAHLKRGIFVSQQKYVFDLLQETRKIGCKPIETPIDSNHKLREASGDAIVDNLEKQVRM